jgi:serine/threonine-protein kinase
MSQELVDARFELGRKLGAGAAGEAWLAFDRVGGGTCVLKLMQPWLAESPDMLERFRREVLALSKVRHPHVVELVASGSCPARAGLPYYAMAWSPGTPLDAILKRSGKLAPARALRLIDQLLQVLEHAQAQGVLHRDLKPANLLIERPGPQEHLRVLDFGLAKHFSGGDKTRALLTKGTVGTPLYLAPEQ